MSLHQCWTQAVRIESNKSGYMEPQIRDKCVTMLSGRWSGPEELRVLLVRHELFASKSGRTKCQRTGHGSAGVRTPVPAYGPRRHGQINILNKNLYRRTFVVEYWYHLFEHLGKTGAARYCPT